MKHIVPVFLLTLVLTQTSAFAHDEGHGPKLTDTAIQGGVVSPVVEAKDAKLGEKAQLVLKSELVRSEDGTVRVYFYDKDMNPVELTKFAKEARGILAFKKGKKWQNATFTLKQEEGAFVAKAPKASSKPFNIDIHVKESGRELLTAFDNLD